jgi:RHS repeat-associated protein
VTIFVYDASGKLIAEYETNAPQTGGKIQYTTQDTLGSPRVLTDEKGEVTSRRDFLPFGEEITTLGGRTTDYKYGQADKVRRKFTTYQRDDETELDYAQARYYAPKLGRFTSPDEFSGGPEELYDFVDDAADNPTFYADINVPQSLNKYQYCYNNPLAYIDPSGHIVSNPNRHEGKSSEYWDKMGGWGEHDQLKNLRWAQRGRRLPMHRVPRRGSWAAGAVPVAPRRTQPRPRQPRGNPHDPWFYNPRFPGLKDHWRGHGVEGMSLKDYFQSALLNIRTGYRVQFRHNGENRVGYVARTGPDTFIFTSTSPNGKIIFTHMILGRDGKPINGQYLRNLGIHVKSYPDNFQCPMGIP